MRFAVIDLGFDTFQLGVVEADALGNQRLLAREQAPTRLGHGLLRSGRIGPEAFQSGLAALAMMGERLRDFGCAAPLAYGGAALRAASNAGEFIAASAELGLPIEVISCEAEARLLFDATRCALPLPPHPAVLASIEGGTTTLTWTTGACVLATLTLPWGPQNLAEALPMADPPGAEDLKRVRRGFRRILKQARKGLPDPLPRPETLLGSQGWILDLLEAAGTGPVLHLEQLRQLQRRLWRTAVAERCVRFGVTPECARILPLAAGWLLALLDWLGVETVQGLPVGRREGMLRLAVGRGGDTAPRPVEARRGAVAALAAKLDPDPDHSRQVTRLADQLFGDLKAALALGDLEQDLLEAAARLHDVGLAQAEKDHHKHGADLLRKAGLTGFTPREVELLAQLVRFHRGRAPSADRHEDYARLAPWHRATVEKLAALLRAADALDRGHRQAVQSVRVGLECEACEIHLQGAGNLQPELEALQDKGALLFRLLDRPVRIVVSAPTPS